MLKQLRIPVMELIWVRLEYYVLTKHHIVHPKKCWSRQADMSERYLVQIWCCCHATAGQGETFLLCLIIWLHAAQGLRLGYSLSLGTGSSPTSHFLIHRPHVYPPLALSHPRMSPAHLLPTLLPPSHTPSLVKLSQCILPVPGAWLARGSWQTSKRRPNSPYCDTEVPNGIFVTLPG